MSSHLRQQPRRQLRFLLMHQDETFLHARLRQFVAPFAPFAMIGAGLLIVLTLVIQWIEQDAPAPALIPLLAAAGLASLLLAPAIRWSAHQLRGDLACLLGCVFIAMFSTTVTVAFAHWDPNITGALSFIVILAVMPIVFWIKPWHFAVGFASAFAPPLIGMLVLDSDAAHWSLLLVICAFTAIVGSLGLFIISACLYVIHEQNSALQMISQQDDLTGLFRRRHWEELAERLLAEAERTGRKAALLFIDLDEFKSINDTHGHHVGDNVLRETARVLVNALPANAIAGRPGGDEFIALLPEVGYEEACAVAERFRDRLALASWPANTLAASVGITEWISGEPLPALIDRADQLMLAEKGEMEVRYRVAISPTLHAHRIQNGSARDRAMVR